MWPNFGLKREEGWASVIRIGERIDLAHVIRSAGKLPEIRISESFQIDGTPRDALARLAQHKGMKRFRCASLLGESQYRVAQLEAPAVPPEERVQALRWRLKDMDDLPVDAASVAVADIPAEGSAKLSLLDARVAESALQRSQVEELIKSLSRSRDENVLADVEAALRVAQQQAAITGSVERLVSALRQSEERLARYDQPRVERVRRAVARDLDKARADRDLAAAALERAREQLRRTVIRAPFSGVVGLRNVSVGEVVDLSRVVTRLESVDQLAVDFDVPERMLPRLPVGLPAEVLVDAVHIQEKDCHDIILANPLFGGGERREVQQNFPIKSGETAYLFLQHFIRKLRAWGRAAVVIKNTFLCNTDNASVALRRELLEACNLHTILDCPQGTFQGAGVKTVVLFFQKGEPTRRIWYYQLDPGRSMGKTNPLNDDDMAEFVALQRGFVTGPKSWVVDVADVDAGTVDLSAKNPNAPEAEALRSPEAIIDAILAPSGAVKHWLVIGN